MSALDNLMNYNIEYLDPNEIPLFNQEGISDNAKVLLKKIHQSGYELFTIKDGVQVPTEMFIMLTTKGNQVINAIAGGGKTTAIIFKLMFDIENGELENTTSIKGMANIPTFNRILVCTYLKSGAQELKRSFESWQTKFNTRSVDNIEFCTLDAEFKRCLNSIGVETVIADEDTLFNYFKMAVKNTPINSADYKEYNMDDEDYRNFYALITMWRSRVNRTNLDIRSMDISVKELDLVCANFKKIKTANNVMDFIDMTELLYKYLYVTPNKNVQDYVANRYSYIYIDEFQDTSQLAYAILKYYARNCLKLVREHDIDALQKYNVTAVDTSTKIVFVGDVSQCIYTFRGSDSHILSTETTNDFAPSNTKLSINWRCPSNILNPIIPSIHKNYDSADQQIYAAKEGGEFHAYHFDTINEMCHYLYDSVCKDVDMGKSVVVLCRTNYDGALPAFIFEQGGRFLFSISNDTMTMKTTVPRKILGVISLFTERFSKNISASLSLLLNKGDWEEKQKLSNALENCKKSSVNFIWDSELSDIEYSLPTIYPFIKGLREKGNNLNGLLWAYEYIQNIYLQSKSRYSNLIIAYSQVVIDMLHDYLSVAEGNKYYISSNGFCYNLDGSRKTVVLRDTRECAKNLDNNITSVFGKIDYDEKDDYYYILRQDDFDGQYYRYKIYEDYGDIFDFQVLINRISNNLEASVKKSTGLVSITTVHEYKGKEADCIYIWNDSDGVFPSKKTNTLISQSEALMEERRLHYVACTRAKEKEIILALKGAEGEFTKEMPITFEKP